MAKKSRKAKAKKSDFQKVKLKVGKKKPRASNATETAFKSQSIYIPEQLKNVSVKKTSDESHAEQKTNIDDLLVQVGHYNPNFRTDALSGLKVHLANNRHLIAIHLPKIIEKISKLIIDSDAQVRKSCAAVFKILFASLTSKQISPFFDAIVSHLHCAMTHIYEDIQRDSLQIMDLSIEYFPDLLSKNNQNQLLQHFIELISTKKSSTVTKSNNHEYTGSNRVLSMRLSKKESSVSWRIKVLSRLYALLKASYDTGQKTRSRVLPQVSSLKFENVNFEMDSSNGIVLPSNSTNVGDLLASYNSDFLWQNHISLRCNSLNVMESLNSVNNNSQLTPWQLMTTLFPLLFDAWLEVSVDKKSLDVETVQTMSIALNIIVLLSKEFISSSDNAMDAITKIRKEYMKDFEVHFVASFPFHHHGSDNHQLKKKRGKKQCDDIQTLLGEIQNCNLLICELVTLLALERELQSDSEFLSFVAVYISSLLIPDGSRRKIQISSESMDQMIRSTKKLLDISADQGTAGNLLRPLLLFSQKLSGNHPLKTQILEFFLDLHSSQKELKYGLHCNHVMVEWLCSLPGYLVFLLHSRSKLETEGKCRNLADQGPSDATNLVLSCMRLASLQNNKEYLKSLEMKLEIILFVFTSTPLFCDPHMNVDEELVYCKHCSNLQARIFEIVVCFSVGLTDKHMKQLSHFCHLVTVSPKNVYYLTEMLVERARSLISRDEYPMYMLSVYKCICTAIIGLTRDESSALKDTSRSAVSYQILDIIPESLLGFKRHHQLLTVMCKYFSTVEHLSQMFQELFCCKLLGLCKLPAKCVLGITMSCNEILKLGHLSPKQNNELTVGLSRLCAQCLLACNETEAYSNDEYIVRMLEQNAFNLLERDNMMDEFLQYYRTTDFSSVSVSDSLLLVLEKIVINSKLHRKFLSCKCTAEQVFRVLKSQDNGISKNPRFIFLTEAMK